MLHITPQHQLFIAVEPVDFRNGIDGLQALCKRHWDSVDPFDGQIFVFRNRRSTAVKLLLYDGNGFWLSQKRFSTGTLAWWPRCVEEAATVRAIELLLTLQQGTPRAAQVPADWRRLPTVPMPRDNSTVTTAPDSCAPQRPVFAAPLNCRSLNLI